MLTMIRIAFRNTSRQKKRSFLLGGAIAFGMMIITLLNAFTAGMVDNIKYNFSHAFGGHIFISGSQLTDSGKIIGRVGSDGEVVTQALEEIEPMIQNMSKRSRTFSSLIFGSKQTMQRIDGVDFSIEKNLEEGLTVVSGSLSDLSDERALILPAPTATKLGVEPGETILVKLPTVTGQQNVGEFRVIATIEDQGSFGLSTAYANLAYLNGLIGLGPDEYQSLNVFLKDMEDTDRAADILYSAIASAANIEPRYADAEGDEEEKQNQSFGRLFGATMSADEDVERWEGTKFAMSTLNEMMEPVQSMVNVLNTVGLVIFIILLIITMVGIMNTFRMILIERTKEIGTMRACGMQRGMVRNIFLTEASFIGLGGGIAGITLASIVMFVLSRMQLIKMSAMQFFLRDGFLTFTVMPADIIANILILLFLSLLAAYMPARAAARLKPAKALGSHF